MRMIFGFTLIILGAIIAVGGVYMVFFNGLTKSDTIQLIIALILGATLLVIFFNLFFFWRQYELTQTLNQPICGFKEFRIVKVPDRPDVMKL
jgi:hypothetical protein